MQMTKGQNASKVVADVKREIDDCETRLPPGVRIVPYYDRTELVAIRSTPSPRTCVGAVLVVAILIVFLRRW